MSAAQIVIQGVNKVFSTDGGELVALQGMDLEIARGQFTCLLGSSGCGNTLLNAVAGFALPTSGSITADGRPVTGPGPEHGIVFQRQDVALPRMRLAMRWASNASSPSSFSDTPISPRNGEGTVSTA